MSSVALKLKKEMVNKSNKEPITQTLRNGL